LYAVIQDRRAWDDSAGRVSERAEVAPASAK